MQTILKLPITVENYRYWYKGRIARIVDGDSYRIDIDFGMNITKHNYECRGYGYDTWETRSRPSGISDEEWEEHKAKGRAAAARAEDLMPVGKEVDVLTHKDDEGKYGRLLITVYIPADSGLWIDLTETLREEGHLKS